MVARKYRKVYFVPRSNFGKARMTYMPICLKNTNYLWLEKEKDTHRHTRIHAYKLPTMLATFDIMASRHLQ